VSLYALHMSTFSTKVCVVLTLSLMRSDFYLFPSHENVSFNIDAYGT